MYKVVLVDDEVLIRDAISKNIKWESLGFELVSCCQNGKEVVEYIEDHSVDLVITDICMPYMDGMELSKFLWENHREVKVIIFSGYDEFEYAQKALKYKVEEYLLKPITSVELSEILTNIKIKMDQEKETTKRISTLKKKFFQTQFAVRSKTLNNLMLGIKTEEEYKKDLEEINIDFTASYYKVVAIEVDEYSDLSVVDEDIKQDADIMFFSVFNITEELVNRQKIGEVFRGHNNQIYIILKTNYKEQLNNAIISLCRQIQFEVKRYFNANITIGLGTYVQSLSKLSISFKESQEAIRYRYILGKGQVINIEEIRSQNSDVINIDNEIEELAFYIKTDNEDKMKKQIQKIADEFVKSYLSNSRSMFYWHLVILAIKGIIYELDIVEGNCFEEEPIFLNNLSKQRLISDAVQIMQKYCLDIMKIVRTQKEKGGERIARMAIEYIEKNYADCNMSLNTVCEYLCISQSHFSKLFKTYTGSTFVEILSKTRIDNAKELLANTSLKNYEIAEKVGFSDPHYFSVSFKKMTGKTPKEYAKERR